MTEVILAKYKVKVNKKHIWVNWCNELKKRKDEVLETLRAEKVYSESCFISQDGETVYIFMEASDIKIAQEIGKNSKFSIDESHKQTRLLSLEFVEVLTELFHFETIHELPQ